ncbi:helix-turn-helix DNA binding domain protein [Arthrobacter phage Cole]|uniref:Helix-turn-helix DNA binding domain protein n=1 Tax=Arthrobacter phage Cole TaxID=2944951 RepID=A0A9E7E5N8_9CAUD|nr:helix-turn-helix DNA binding domain protein [Arthrobacter phage Cole]URC18077.1 helix-turn-helix DNA binding domain protein [Arthrobacter phage Cole]
MKPAAYSHWEAGRNTPRNLVTVAQRIEMLTGIPATWTLGLMDGPQGGGPGTPKKADSVSNLKPLDYKVGDSDDDSGDVIKFTPRRYPVVDQPLRKAA